MTDKQWDELVESFEVLKYGGEKEDAQRVPEKDLLSSQCKRQRGWVLLFS